MYQSITNLIKNSLCVSEKDNCVCVYDEHNYATYKLVKKAFFRTGHKLKSFKTDYSGIGEPSESLTTLLLDDTHNVFIFILEGNIWHTKARKKAKYELRKRLVSILCSPSQIDCNSGLVETSKLSRLACELYEYLKNTREVNITTSMGTNISAEIGQPFCEDGDYSQPSSGGDYPSGEIGFGPVEGTVNGTIVYDFKMKHIGLFATSFLEMKIRNDRVERVVGQKRELFSRLVADYGDIINYVSEVSIGVNPLKIKVRCKDSIVEEKNLGTVHFGHGGNLSYGNRVGKHLDGVLTKPTIKLDNTILMQEGKLNTSLISEESSSWLKSLNKVLVKI